MPRRRILLRISLNVINLDQNQIINILSSYYIYENTCIPYAPQPLGTGLCLVFGTLLVPTKKNIQK